MAWSDLAVPAGVVLGAVVSGSAAYLGVKKAAGDNLAAQRLTIEANQRMAEAEREEAIARERREHKREAYVRLIGLLGQLDQRRHDVLVKLEEVMYRAHRNIADFGLTDDYKNAYSEYATVWDEAIQLARAYGSKVLVRAVEFLGQHRPFIAAYRASGKHVHASNILYHGDGGTLCMQRITVAKYDDSTEAISDFYELCEGSGRILAEVTEFCLSQMRYELQIDESPPPPMGLEVRKITPGKRIG